MTFSIRIGLTSLSIFQEYPFNFFMTASQSKQDLKEKKNHTRTTTDNMKHSHLHTSSLLVSEGLGTGKAACAQLLAEPVPSSVPDAPSAVCCSVATTQRTRVRRRGPGWSAAGH